MSSVGNTRANSNDQLRNQREEYQEREAELVKRQKAEARRTAQRHATELESIRKNYEARINEIKNRSNNQLSERDIRHQDEIDQLRGMYSDQVRKKVEENEERRRINNQSYEQQRAKDQEINQQQKALLSEQYNTNLRDKERAYAEADQVNRETMQDAIYNQARKLNQKHEREMALVNENRDQAVANASIQTRTARNELGSEVRDMQRRHSSELSRKENHYLNVLREKEIGHDVSMQVKNEDLQQARRSMQSKYQNAIDQKNDEMDRVREDLIEKASGRSESQLNSYRQAAHRERNLRFEEGRLQKGLHDIEKTNIVHAYEDRIQKIESEKGQLNDLHKDLATKRIDHVNDRNEMIMNTVNQEHQNQKRITAEKHKEDRHRVVAEYERRLEQANSKTDGLANKVRQAAVESQSIQQRQHQENLAQLKDNYSEKVMTQRQAQLEQMKDTYVRMEQRLAEQNQKHVERLDQLKENYEYRLREQNDKFTDEMRRRDVQSNRQVVNQDKRHKTEIQMRENKFNQKLSQLEDAHQKDIERLERRHQEQMAGLANRLDYYRRKA